MSLKQHLMRTDISWLLAVNLLAFIGFHMTVEFNGTTWFQSLTFHKLEWLDHLVGIWGFYIWTVGCSLYLMFLSIVKKSFLSGVFAILAFSTFFKYSYPMVTGLLVEVGQFPRIGLLVFEQTAKPQDFLGIAQFSQ
jgi:hypothetical protein